MILRPTIKGMQSDTGGDNEMAKYRWILYCFGLILTILWLGSGCKSDPVIIDTGDIEKLRYEYQYLRDQYDKLRQDYNDLTESSKRYAEYYQSTTESIKSGLDQLSGYGTSSIGEIDRIREYLKILAGIINSIIEGQSGEGSINPIPNQEES
jgi:hypothetical protein